MKTPHSRFCSHVENDPQIISRVLPSSSQSRLSFGDSQTKMRKIVKDSGSLINKEEVEEIDSIPIDNMSPMSFNKTVSKSKTGQSFCKFDDRSRRISLVEIPDGRTNAISVPNTYQLEPIIVPVKEENQDPSSRERKEKQTPMTPKRHMKKMKTKMFMDYFGDEESEKLNRFKLENEYFYSESEVNFSLSQYAEFFVYHLIYFMLLGPFIAIFMIFKPKLRFLFYNMEFIRPNAIAVVQALYWLITMYIIIGFIIAANTYNSQDTVFDMTMFKTIITSIVLRTTSIAGKYATYPRLLVKKYKEVKISRNIITQEFMLIGWLLHGSDIRQTEIMNSIDRLEIDESTFVESYMSAISLKCINQLKQLVNERKLSSDSELCYTYQMNDKSFTYYRADIIFEYLVMKYNKTMKYKTIIFTGVFLGITWSFVPSFLRLSTGINFYGYSPIDITATFMNGLLSSFLFYVQFMFYSQAIVDLSRKYYIMCQLSYMLSPRILKQYTYPKLLPTISILDPVSMHTWYNMRRMTLDYGRKYFYRHEIFLPVNLFLMLLNIVIFFTYLYISRTKEIGYENTSAVSRLLYSCSIDGLLFMWAGFHFMYSAGRLNDEFDVHSALIAHNRGLISNLLQFRHYYFSDIIGPVTRIGRDLKKILPKNSRSALHTIVRDEVIKLLGEQFLVSENQEEILTEFLTELVADYDKLSDDLNRDKLFEQVKILGFAVQKNSVLNFAFAIISAIFTVYQLLFPGS